jgi:hypothetical protein
VQKLSQLRREKNIHSYWTLDGKIFYKECEKGKRRPVKEIDEIENFVPDPDPENHFQAMVENPWKDL